MKKLRWWNGPRRVKVVATREMEWKKPLKKKKSEKNEMRSNKSEKRRDDQNAKKIEKEFIELINYFLA